MSSQHDWRNNIFFMNIFINLWIRDAFTSKMKYFLFSRFPKDFLILIHHSRFGKEEKKTFRFENKLVQYIPLLLWKKGNDFISFSFGICMLHFTFYWIHFNSIQYIPYIKKNKTFYMAYNIFTRKNKWVRYVARARLPTQACAKIHERIHTHMERAW